VFVTGPGPRLDAWTYVTSGCWPATEQDGHGLEFILTANQDLDRCVELLAINAFYHAGPPSQRLDHVTRSASASHGCPDPAWTTR